MEIVNVQAIDNALLVVAGILAVVGLIGVVSALISKKVSPEPEQGKVKSVTVETEKRYRPQKASLLKSEPTHFGRWKITLNDGKELTRMGRLPDILATLVNVKSYREIK